MDVESSFFVGLRLRLRGLKKLGLWLRLQALKIPRLQLHVKVEHRLLNLCDCDSVLSERWRQTNSQNLKNNNNPVLLWSYLNLISVISCSETVHPWFGLLHTIHYFIIFYKIMKTGTADAESSFLVRLRLQLRDLKQN